MRNMTTSALKENKMGTMPIGKLLLRMAFPMALSMLVQALYNVVDSAFVAKLSDVDQNALNAVSLVFPVQNIMIGLAMGIGVGVNALLSRGLGQGDADTVRKSALNGVFLTAIAMLLTVAFGIFFAEPFMRSQTANETVIAYGVSYIRIITIVSFGIFGETIFEKLLQSTGRTFYTFITQGTGAVINIILDPILIFGLWGMPRMEVAGAAVATVIGQIVACILALLFNRFKNPEVSLRLRGFRPNFRMIGRILAIGIPSTIMVAITSVTYYFFVRVLMRFEALRVGLGEVGTAVYGAYSKLQSFIFMPVFGINNASLAIAAYNYGARKPARIKKTVKCAAIGATALMLIGLLLFQCFPAVLLGFFNADAQMLSVGAPALRALSLAFLFAGVCISFGGIFQALGNSVFSMLVSISRQIIVLLPAAYLLSLSGSINAVWYAYPISEIISVLASAWFLSILYRKRIQPLYSPAEAEN
ncbi:MAG: MATE family efflux transporter [Oscillospiraceae bacterium]|jgi:putative MATE family efflux protein|nr:MATE family efflux transporter [Oscillospiraceae bacterium]